MANYATLKAAIEAVIYENGNQEITGSVMQATLLAMVNSLGANYQYAGIATPSTNPGTPDQNVFYLASTAGTYVNFDNIVLAENEVAILKYNGSWTKEASGFASAEVVNSLNQQINGEYISLTPSFDSWTEKRFVLYTNGSLQSATSLKASGFVDISEYAGKTIHYARLQMEIASVAGIAFYNSNQQYISGVQCIQNAASRSVVDATVVVPANAKYIRVSAHMDAQQYGAFFCYVGYESISTKVANLENKTNELGRNVGERGNDVSIGLTPVWKDNTYVYSSGAGIGQERSSSSGGCSTDYIEIGGHVGDILRYTRLKTTVANVTSGLCFYDKNKTPLSGVDNIGRQSAISYELYDIIIPDGAVYARFTYHMTIKSSFDADIISDTYSSGIGLKTESLQKEVYSLQKEVDSLTDVTDPNTPQESRNRFYIAMLEWCKCHGIEGAIIEGPSGYGAGGDVSPEVLTHGQSSLPIYGVAKLLAIATSYPLITQIANKDYYCIETKGNEASITVESSLHSSSYGTALTDYYDVLLYKTGTKWGSAVNIAAVCHSADFGGKLVIGVITTSLATETSSANRYLAFKYLMDIAKAKIANPSADVSELQSLLVAQNTTSAVAVVLPYADAKLYHHIDLSADEYNLYSYNPVAINPMSIIKLLTAIVMLDYIKDIDKYVTITSADVAAASGGSNPTFSAGQSVTFRDLAHAMLMPSSNLAGYAIARKVGQYLLKTYRGSGFLPTN